jgi:RHS repeat-associated protein
MKRPLKTSTCWNLLSVALLAIGLAGTAIGQTTAQRPDRGAMPGASYSVSDVENVSLTNGNLSLTIPLASLPPIAGGKLKLGISAVYNSKLWNITRVEHQMPPFFQPPDHAPVTSNGCQDWVVSNPQLSDIGGWTITAGYRIVFRAKEEDYAYVRPNAPPSVNCEGDLEEQLRLQSTYYRTILITPDGAEHELRPTGTYQHYGYPGSRSYLFNYYRDTPKTTNQSMRYYSFDGSFIYAVIDPYSYEPTSWTVYMNDGTKVTQAGGIQRITDTNGNSIKIIGKTLEDELTGRQIQYDYEASGNGGAGQGYVRYQTPGGDWQTIYINYGTTHVQGKLYRVDDWNFSVNGETGDGAACHHNEELDQQVPVIRSIVFPVTEPGLPGRQFSFNYNSDTTETATDQALWSCESTPETYTRTVSHGLGSLSQITMPSGAVSNYSYSRDSTHDFSLFGETDKITRETITQKTLVHDGVTDTWHYDIYEFGACGGTVTGPDGSTTVESCYAHDAGAGAYNASLPLGGFVFRSNKSNKQIVERHWTQLIFTWSNTGASGNYGDATFNPVVDAEYTTLLDDTTNHAPLKMSAKTYQYDYNGNLTQETDYDWFDPALVSRGADGMPTGVPASATVLRVVDNTYYNGAGTNDSGNVYAKRSNATPLILGARQQTTIGPAVSQFSYDGYAYGTAPTAGNLTRQSAWDNVDNKWITSSQTYGDYGNLITKTDARGKVTQFFYDDNTHALPNRVVVDPQNGTGTQTTARVFDYYTGLVTSETDPNNKVSTVDYTNQLLQTVDPFGRPGVAIGPLVNAGGTDQHHRTTTFYEDHLLRATVASDLYAENDKLLKSRTTSDMLGRPILSEQTEDGTTYSISSRKAYDVTGRITFASNPARSAAATTDGWTRATTDVLGRVREVASFSGATQPPPTGTDGNWTGSITSVYDANKTTVTDQAGKARRSEVDALGKLTTVVEDPSGLAYQTTYEYDVLGNLITVVQGTQTRTFTYDSLSHLRSALNPESGTITYNYDDNGNLLHKTDARGVVSTYDYDSLNRNTSIVYTNDAANTPSVTRTYDGATNGVGRIWKSQTSGNAGSLTTIDAYDALGRPTIKRQQFYKMIAWTASYKVARSYDLAGHVAAQTYPSGHVVTYNYDQAGRLGDKDANNLALTGNLGDGVTRAYAAGLNYDAGSRITEEKYGTRTPLYHKQRFNARGQLYDIRLSTVSSQTDQWNWNRGAIATWYDSTSGFPHPATNGTDNNGNLLRSEVSIPNDDQISSSTSFQQRYDYDSLNRLTAVTELQNGSTTSFTQAYTHDRWGNRTINQAATTQNVGINTLDTVVDPVTNRMYAPNDPGHTQIDYDDAGNQTLDSLSSTGARTYDAENRMKTAFDSTQYEWVYTYDADGQRTRRVSEDGDAYWWQVYGFDGELLAEYVGGWYGGEYPTFIPHKEYGYRAGQLLITADSGDEQRLLTFMYRYYQRALPADYSYSGFSTHMEALGAAANASELNEAVKNFARSLFNSSQYAARNRSDYDFIYDLYITCLNRQPDQGGWDYWTSQVPSQGRANVLESFIGGAEFNTRSQQLYGIYSYDNERTNALVTKLYVTILNREPSSANNWAELTSAQNAINAASALGRAQVAAAINTLAKNLFQSQEYIDRNRSDRDYVSDVWWAFWQQSPSTYPGAWDIWTDQVAVQGRTAVLNAFNTGDGLADGIYREIKWLTPDHLGTPRMVAERTGALAGMKRHDYLPFGEELSANQGGRTAAQGYVADGVREKFTSKERDTETGLDYFLARYYAPTQGRFTSPDEFKGGPDELFVLGSGDDRKQALPYAEIHEPQSLNKYAYVYNNPCRYVDPDGHCGTPQGLKPGQVGICVASFIASRIVKSGGMPTPGRGDGRGPNGQGGTSRVEVRVTVDVSKGSVTKTDEAMARSGILVKDLGPQGKGGSFVSGSKTDDKGNVYFQIHQLGTSNTPAALAGSIENHLNMVVTRDGKVGVTESSSVKDYPSTEVYKYTMDDKGNVTTTLIMHKGESNNVFDLGNKEKPIKAEPK